jgi:hypothetical protein
MTSPNHVNGVAPPPPAGTVQVGKFAGQSIGFRRGPKEPLGVITEDGKIIGSFYTFSSAMRFGCGPTATGMLRLVVDAIKKMTDAPAEPNSEDNVKHLAETCARAETFLEMHEQLVAGAFAEAEKKILDPKLDPAVAALVQKV